MEEKQHPPDDPSEKEKGSAMTRWKSKKTIEKRILLSRTLVFLTFAVIGALLGVFSYLFLSREEESNYESQYEALADDFISKVQTGLETAHSSTSSVAGMICMLHRDGWPFVWVTGFNELFLQSASTSSSFFCGVAPLVRRDQVSEFNAFNTNYTGLLIRDYITAKPYNESSGYFGEYAGLHADNLILPLSNIAPALYSPLAGIDLFVIGRSYYYSIIDCVARTTGSSMAHMPQCSVLAEVVDVNEAVAPTLFVFVPVLVGEEVVALVGTAILMTNMLVELAPPDMPPLTCVIEPSSDNFGLNTITYTFQISGSHIKYLGRSDLHDSDFDDMQRSATVALDTHSANSSQYKISFYPTKSFRSSFISATPAITCSLAVFVAALVGAIFFLYDRAVHAESLAREVILETKKKFVRYISHEIRTPLNTVLLGLEVLHVVARVTAGGNDWFADSHHLSSAEKDIADIAAEVKTGAVVAVTVLNDLLDYDRLDMSRMHISAKPIPALSFLHSTLSTLRRQLIDNAHLTSVTFTSDLFASGRAAAADDICFGPGRDVPATDVFLLGDMYRLAQVIRHMISNSLKYVPHEGQVAVSVRWSEEGATGKGLHDWRESGQHSGVDLEDDDVHARFEPCRCGVMSFSVRDNGPGISRAFVSEVFADEVDFDTRLGRSKGLGLCISKQIVTLHRGRIWATANALGPGVRACGSTFTIELPVYCLPEDRRGSLTIPRMPSDSSRRVPNAGSNRKLSITNSSRINVSNRKLSITSVTHRELDSTAVLSPSSQVPVPPSPLRAKATGSGKFNAPISIECKHGRILVVDDSDPSRKIVCKLLARHGFVCDQAVDGLECLQLMADSAMTLASKEAASEVMMGEALAQKQAREQPQEEKKQEQKEEQKHQELSAGEDIEEQQQGGEGAVVEKVCYDCILMDSEMPRMSGPTAARRLRSLGHTLPIIGLTGNVLSDDVEHFLQHGADHVMFKPFQFDSFHAMIVRHTGTEPTTPP